jgi:hypothetical protein
MFYGIDVGGISVQALADHPAHLAVVVDPGTQEFGPGIEDEVALYLLIYILKFVVVCPDIVPGTCDDVLAGFRDISGRSGFNIGTDIAVTVKNAYRLRNLRKDNCSTEEGSTGKQKQGVSSFTFHLKQLKF